MVSPKDVFIKLLKQNGHSITSARVAVFDALVGCESININALVKRVGQIDRASVYRAVDLFEQLGVVQRLHTGWKYKIELTDRFAEHHHHLTCTNCGKTISMNEQELELLISKLARDYDFTPTAHQIEIQGLCRDCR